MKFHETSFDEYLQTSYKINFHPDFGSIGAKHASY